MFFPNKAVDDITITSCILCFPGRIPMNVVCVSKRYNMIIAELTEKQLCLII